MREKIINLVRSRNLCVLATSSQQVPHLSLMSFAASSDCRAFFLASPRSTRKWANILANPEAALLIDNREQAGPDDFTAVLALSVAGVCQGIDDPEEAEKAAQLLRRQAPRAASLIARPGCGLLRFEARSWQLETGGGESYYQEFGAQGDAHWSKTK